MIFSGNISPIFSNVYRAFRAPLPHRLLATSAPNMLAIATTHTAQRALVKTETKEISSLATRRMPTKPKTTVTMPDERKKKPTISRQAIPLPEKREGSFRNKGNPESDPLWFNFKPAFGNPSRTTPSPSGFSNAFLVKHFDITTARIKAWLRGLPDPINK